MANRVRVHAGTIPWRVLVVFVLICRSVAAEPVESAWGGLEPKFSWGGLDTERGALLRELTAASSEGERAWIEGKLEASAGRWNRAVEHFQEVERLIGGVEPTSDLAASYLKRFEAEGDPRDLFRALEAAERAVEMDGQRFGVLWNRAAALDRATLVRSGKVAMDELGQRSEASPADRLALSTRARSLGHTAGGGDWGETKKRLEDLWESRSGFPRPADGKIRSDVRGLVMPWLRHARALVTDELMPAWAGAVLTAELDRATDLLWRAETIAEALDELGTDRLVVTVVRSLRELGPVETERRREWASVLSSLEEPEACSRPDAIDAAVETLTDWGHAYVAWARFLQGYCALSAHEYARSDAIFRRLIETVPEEQSHQLRDRVVHLLAHQDLSGGDYARGLVWLRQLQATYETRLPGERGDGLGVLIAETLRTLGRHDEAWAVRLRSLTATAGTQVVRKRAAVLGEACDAALAMGAHRAARRMAAEMARLEEDPLVLVDALRLAAEVSSEAGLRDEAEAYFDRAEDRLEGVEDPAHRRLLHLTLRLSRARFLLDRNPAEALRLSEDALDFSETSGTLHFAPDLERVRASALRKLGRLRDAATAYTEALDRRETIRQSLNPLHRREYFDGLQALFDDAIGFAALDGGDFARAFELSEQARARTLLDLSVTGAKPLSLAEVRDGLPASTAMLGLVVLETHLLRWWIDADGPVFRSEPLGAADLRERVDGYLAELRGGGGDQRRGRVLYDLLLAPFEDRLAEVEKLVVVPDDRLYELPFAALVDARDRFLVEKVAVSLAPSATVYLRLADRAAAAQRPGALSILSVGVSEFRGAETGWVGFEDLPGAHSEAESVAEGYERQWVLRDEEATSARIHAVLPQVDVLHLATHMSHQPDLPERSALLLIGDDGTPEPVYAEALREWELGELRVVVLSACRTLESFPTGREGVAGIARPFQEAGVPAVVASLWPVEDGVTSEFMDRMHRYLAGGAGAAEALRQAQVKMLRAIDREARHRVAGRWAGFVSIGVSD